MTDPVRPKFFAIAKRLVAPGGIIVLDDAWRYPQLRSSGSRVKRFVGLGPARLERTETDVFFY
jgi:predicted O-methyltransferase YrrM